MSIFVADKIPRYFLIVHTLFSSLLGFILISRRNFFPFNKRSKVVLAAGFSANVAAVYIALIFHLETISKNNFCYSEYLLHSIMIIFIWALYIFRTFYICFQHKKQKLENDFAKNKYLFFIFKKRNYANIFIITYLILIIRPIFIFVDNMHIFYTPVIYCEISVYYHYIFAAVFFICSLAGIFFIYKEEDNMMFRFELISCIVLQLFCLPGFILGRFFKIYYISLFSLIIYLYGNLIFSYFYLAIQTFRVKATKFTYKASLSNILKCGKGKEELRKFLEMEFSSENLDFYEAVEKFKTLPNEELSKMAVYIFQMFIKPGADYQVNISGLLIREIQNKINENDFDRNMFSRAQYSVIIMIENDSFRRFKSMV